MFSCTLDGPKAFISLCAGPASAAGEQSIRFVSGTLGAPEVEFASDPSGETETRFRRTPLTYAGSTGGYAYSAGQGDEIYVLYSISGDGGLERQGMLVTDVNVERAILDRACMPGSVVESGNRDLRARIATWPAEERLEKSGLPPVAR